MRIPPKNLSVEATPWANWAEQAITQLQQDAERRAQGETNMNKGQTGALATLAKQIQSLQETDARVDAIIARLVDPVTLEDRQSGFTLTGSLAVVAQASTAVPPGCTRAIVFATAVGGLTNGEPSGWSTVRLQSRVESGAVVLNSPLLTERLNAGEFGNSSATQSVELASLVAGDPVTVSAVMSFPSAHSLTSAVVSALVTFVP